MAITQNNYSKLDLFQGTDFIRAIRVADIDGAPESLVGYSLFAQMRKNYESKKSWKFDILKNERDFILFMDQEQTKYIRPGYYNYDVIMTHATNVRTVLFQGVINVLPTFTQ
jgi:hypothetical protein